jgi:PA domain
MHSRVFRTLSVTAWLVALSLLPSSASALHSQYPQADGGISPIQAFSKGYQHGGAGGHLPPVQRNVELVGKLDLFQDEEQPGRIADVSSFGNYAYLGAFASPNCEGGGVYVIDISNPRNPQEVDFVPTGDPTSFVGEGVQILNMNTAFFQGPVLIYNNETCAPFGGPVLGDDPRLGLAGPGGATLVDVRDPENWSKLADHVGDNDPPPPGALPSGFPHNSHSAFGWQQGDKAYMVVVDNGEFGTTDIDIFDITNPRAPVMIAETGMEDFPEIQEDPPPNGNNAFLHDMVVKKVGDRYLLLASYWDGGYLILDVTNLPEVRFLRDTDFGPVEPFSAQLGLAAGVTPEGNAHQAEFNHDNSMFIGTDEDFGPFRFLGTITSGTFQGHTFTGTEGNATPPIDREEGLAGPSQFIGQGCGAGTPAPSPNHIALMERGTCTFSIKVQTADALGYKAAVIFNDSTTDAPNCDAQLFMLAVGDIPSLFVGRSTALKLLNADPGANSCDTPTPPPGAGESFDMEAHFDGWGYLHLYDANTMQAIDHYAIPESLDESKADGFGDLSVHEVAMDPVRNRGYISYYSGGFRILDFDARRGIREVGAYIAEGGNNFWGVEVHPQQGSTEPLVLASDRDSGLWIFRFKKGANSRR